MRLHAVEASLPTPPDAYASDVPSVGTATLLLLFDDTQERVDDIRIELTAALPFDLSDGLVDRPCRFVGSFLRQCVEHVRNGDDSSRKRNLIADQAGVATPVPLFM